MKFTVKQDSSDNSSGAVCMGYYDVLQGKIPIDAEPLAHKITDYYMAMKYTKDSFGDIGELSPKQKRLVQMEFCDPLKMIDIIRANGNRAMFYIPQEANNRIKGIKRLYMSPIMSTKITNGTITIPQDKYGIIIYGVESKKERNLHYLFFFYDASGNLCYVNPWDGQSIAMRGTKGYPPEYIPCSNPKNGYPLILYYLYAGIIIG